MPQFQSPTFNRVLHPRLERLLVEGRSVLLFGPRQTGKSTLAAAVLRNRPDALIYPLQLPEVRARLEADPAALRREVEAAAGPAGRAVVFIDEVQKLPILLDTLQYLIDAGKAVLLATGSSARKMRHGTRNWLPGRVVVEHLHPLCAGECPGAELSERLLYGGLPGVLKEGDLEQRAALLRSYSAIYLEEEVRQEALVRSLPPFSRFLQLAALASGTCPNLSDLAGKVGVSQPTLREYYQILEDSLVAVRVPAFGMGRADVMRRPRWYFFDTGVRNAAAGLGHHPGLLPLQAGPLFEHAVLGELRARGPAGARVSYWRTRAGAEVDFIVEWEGKTAALEVKHTDRPGPKDLAGLAAFRSQERDCPRFLVCRVERAQKFDAGTALPFERLADAFA